MSTTTPAVIPASMMNLVMQPPAELASSLWDNFSGAYEDFSATFRTISFKGFQFTLKEGSASEVYPQQFLPCVILGVGADNHCIYYNKGYDPSTSDAVQPDFVWYEKSGHPAGLPAQALQPTGQSKHGYQIRRRMVVALLRQDPNNGQMIIDLDNPYCMDIGAKSIYGADIPNMMAFGFSGLVRYCKRQRIMPLHFVTKVIFDRSESVPTVRFIPSTNQNGQLLFLDEANLTRVYQTAASPEIADLLKVRLRPDPNEMVAPEAQPYAQPAPAPAPQVAPIQVNEPIAPAEMATPTLGAMLMDAAARASAEAEKMVQAQPEPEPVVEAKPASRSALDDLLSSVGAYDA